MLVNSGVARFQDYAHETVSQILESLRTFQRVVGISRRPQFISLIEAARQRVDFLLSQGKPLWRAVRQGTGEALSGQSHLRLLATRARDGVYAILLQSEPFLNSIRQLYGPSSTRKIVPTMIVATFAGLALIIMMLLKVGMGNQAGNEHAGTVKGATPSVAQVPDWTIFDDAFANQSTRLATSEFGAALTQEPAKTTGQLMREPVPLPRPRPKRAGRE
jgi:hypothetical protein